MSVIKWARISYTIILFYQILFCSTNLCIADVAKLRQEVLSVAHVWKPFGLALGVHINTLNAIEQTHRRVGDCLNDTLDDWLRNGSIRESDGPPSWQLVVKAVANPAGGNDCSQAEKIAAKYHGIIIMMVITFMIGLHELYTSKNLYTFPGVPCLRKFSYGGFPTV